MDEKETKKRARAKKKTVPAPVVAAPEPEPVVLPVVTKKIIEYPAEDMTDMPLDFVMPPDTTESGEGEEGADGKPKRPDRYFEAVGRRKAAIARVRLFTKVGDFSVNSKPYGEYFPTLALQKISEDALKKMKLFGRFRVSALILGGGKHAQAEAVRHGLARCLVKFNPDFRKRLKRAGYLKRDPRAKERKKFGLKRARKGPRWAKR
ncbi:MAG: 30S ribosomal protein S9 [bacterium]|nr:30S ribosomal protein S9 [bacterium]MDZ4299551.1 30S ribosomal protein S9 [Candidatus Sungbacteria bacterium]